MSPQFMKQNKTKQNHLTDLESNIYEYIVMHIPIARRRLSIHVPANTTIGAVFSVDRATARC
jgi:hypothetical protein